MLPGLFENVLTNARFYEDFRLFEIGSEIHPQAAPALPEEIPHLAAVLYDAHGSELEFFELKRAAECVFPGMRLAAGDEAGAAYEHPGRRAKILWRNDLIGRIFELHPALLLAEGLEGRAFFLDVDLSRAQALAETRDIVYRPLRKYPTSGFDLSLITELRTPVDLLQDQLAELAGQDLAMIEFVRQYDGPPLHAGQKSVTFNLKVGSLQHTLTADEVTAIRNRIISGAQALGYEIRGL